MKSEYLKIVNTKLSEINQDLIDSLSFENSETKLVLGFVSPHVNFRELSSKVKSFFSSATKVILVTTAGELCTYNLDEKRNMIYNDASSTWDDIVFQVFSEKMIEDIEVLTIPLFSENLDPNSYSHKERVSKISNELDKLMVVLPKESTITPEAIEENIGISKDFNNFELRKAVGERDVLKTNRIINHFAQNQKANPMIMTISLLNSFFTHLLIYHSLKDKSKNSVAKALGANPFFVSDYTTAARNYPMRKVSQVIGLLRDADVKSKGVGANALPAGDILKELLFKIIH